MPTRLIKLFIYSNMIPFSFEIESSKRTEIKGSTAAKLNASRKPERKISNIIKIDLLGKL
tara:strand:- start:772 stop:951 length:180 start_codon:yes stop_codon:yes gene_type:complete